MKNLLIYPILIIFIISCDDKDKKNPQEEEVIEEIIHHFHSDCFTICDEILSIDKNTIHFQKYLPERDSNGNLTKYLELDTTLNQSDNWKNSLKLIDLKTFMQLDSIYIHNDSSFGTTGSYDLIVMTNKSEKKVSYLKGRKVNEINELHNFLKKVAEEIDK